jgi:hypothetical protein
MGNDTQSGTVAVVTGGGRGIALVLGEAGATVYVTDRESRNHRFSELPGTMEDTAEQVTERGGQGIAVPVLDPAAGVLAAHVRQRRARPPCRGLLRRAAADRSRWAGGAHRLRPSRPGHDRAARLLRPRDAREQPTGLRPGPRPAPTGWTALAISPASPPAPRPSSPRSAASSRREPIRSSSPAARYAPRSTTQPSPATLAAPSRSPTSPSSNGFTDSEPHVAEPT